MDGYPRIGQITKMKDSQRQALHGAAAELCFIDPLYSQALRYGKADVLNPFFVAASSASALP